MVYVCSMYPCRHAHRATLTSYPGNFIENGTEGPIKIMVEGANGSKAIEYKMWIAEATMPNDPDTFTFKTV